MASLNEVETGSPIFRAVLSSHIEDLRTAVANGANLDQRDRLGMTPLLYAVWRNDLEAVRVLLEAGADPNLPQDSDPSCTPLWHAQEDFGLFDVAAVLKAFGARL